MIVAGVVDIDFLRYGDCFTFLTDFYRLTSVLGFSKAAKAWVGKTGAEGTIFKGLSRFEGHTFDFSNFFCELFRGFCRLCERCDVHPDDR